MADTDTSSNKGMFGNYGDLIASSGLFGAGMSMMPGFFGDPAGSEQMKQIQQMLPKYFDPFIQAGERQIPGLEQQYGQLTSDPGALMKQIGSGYQQSPGYQFEVEQAQKASDAASARGGMAGSPMQQQQIAKTVTGLAGKDFDQYLSHALGLYGTGLQGMQGMYGTGFQAARGLGEDLSQALMSQANLERAQQAQQQKAMSGMFGDIAGAAELAFL